MYLNRTKWYRLLYILVIGLFIDSSSVVFAAPSTPSPISPARGSVVLPNSDITYTWEESPEASVYDFFIYDRTVPGIIFRKPALDSSLVCSNGVCNYSPPVAAHLPVGEYHVWRVAAINSAGGISAHSYTPFHARKPGPPIPTPVSPARGSVVLPNSDITYTWEESPEASAYDFFIYDRTVPGIIFREPALDSSLVCSNGVCNYSPPVAAHLPVGEYHVWRVAAINSAGGISAHSYTPFHARKPGPPIPTPVSSARGSVVLPNSDITYTWEESPEASSYDFFIYDRTVPGIVFREVELDSSLVCSNGVCSYSPPVSAHLPAGEYHVWRVAAINSAGGISAHSYTPFHARKPGRGNPNYPAVDTINECIINTCVSTSEEFLSAISQSSSSIVLLDGIYDSLGAVTLSSPVSIKSANLWGAVITGDSYLNIRASNVSIEGLRFENGASPSGGQFAIERYGAIKIQENNATITNNYFENIGVNSTVSDGTGITIHIVKSDDVHINKNIFNNSHAIATKSDDASHRLTIMNNDYTDSYNFGGAGEVVHFGDANSIAQGIPSFPDETNNIFAYNYIRNWNLELELISVKSSENIIKNNYFEGSNESAIVVRMGNRNIIENNFMKGNIIYPIRISGEDNIFKGNTFCGQGSAISLHAGRVYNMQTTNLYNSYWAANRNIIENNYYYGYDTIVNYNYNGFSGSDSFESSPEGNLFRGNIMYSENTITNGDNTGISIENNFYLNSKPCPF